MEVRRILGRRIMKESLQRLNKRCYLKDDGCVVKKAKGTKTLVIIQRKNITKRV